MIVIFAVARHIFQACPVWIYTQSNITSILFTWVHYTNTANIIMEYVGNELKLVRGGSLKTSDNATYQDVLSAAKKVKHLTEDFLWRGGLCTCIPWYKYLIQGTKDEFVLKSYNEWLGRSYSRLTLYFSPVAPVSERHTKMKMTKVKF
jgi:hypothetical protein